MLSRRSFLKWTRNAGALGALVPLHTLAAQIKQQIKKQTESDVDRQSASRPFPIYVYHRLGFGPTGVQLEINADRYSYEKYVEEQLHPEKIADVLCDQKLASAKLSTLSKSNQELWKDHKLKVDELKKAQEGKAEKINENELRQQPVRELEAATWIRAIYSERQLQEVLVDFWHDHFSVNGWDGAISPTMVHYDREVIRKNIFGNFREFIEAVARSPSMLLYLDNGLNQSGNPNENFARELFELHTLGAENYLGTLPRKSVPGYGLGKSKGYVDGDVYEAARAFTGWREDSNQKDANNTGDFNYYDTWHDRFQKIVLGREIPEYQPPMKDGLDVLDLVAHHEGTAYFISKKLCRRFISDHPPEPLVRRIKKVFLDHRKSKDQLRQVVKAILLAPEFKNPGATKIKRPFEYSVSLIRSLRRDAMFDFFPDEEFLKKQGALGQRLFQWKTPDGYPENKERWTTSSGMMHRWQFCNQLIDKGLVDLMQFKGDEQFHRSVQKTFFGYESESVSKILQNYLASVPREKNNQLPHPAVKATVLLAMMSPELQWK